MVPSGTNLGHHLQVVDSNRLKSLTHSVDRTAVVEGPVVQRSPEPLRSQSAEGGSVEELQRQGAVATGRPNRAYRMGTTIMLRAVELRSPNMITIAIGA